MGLETAEKQGIVTALSRILVVTLSNNVVSRLLPVLPALLLAALGIGAIIGGRQYQLGSLTSMGPGFMPALCGSLLLLLALFLLVSEWRNQDSAQSVSLPPLIPLACAAGSLLIWALVAEAFGFVPAAMLQLLLACLAVPQERWGMMFAICLVITALTYVLFVMFLGIPLQAFGY